MKFGGSSLANGVQIKKVVDIVRDRGGPGAVVVCSAHKGMTDALLTAAAEAVQSRISLSPVDRQRAVCRELEMPEEELLPFFQELENLLRGIALLRESSPRVMDYVQSFGERMSVRAVAHALRRAGVKARAHDAFDLGFVTDERHGQARPLPGQDAEMKAAFAALPTDVIPVVTGFVGRTRSGEVTTVGRNGSDFSASVLAAALDAEECQIWTDTDGVMTADPGLCSDARSIAAMSFAEASELALYGGRVLHPSTLLPAVRKNIPVRVLNTNKPEHPGTVITEDAPGEGPITSIAYKEGSTVITVASTTMLGQPGFLAKIFDVLGRSEVDIDMISTSEVTVSMTTRQSIEGLPVQEELQSFGKVTVERGRTLICIVGRQIRSEPGIAARVFAALGDAGVNVEMISHGANNINLSIMVRDGEVPRAIPALHAAFFPAA
jgi:aspartate kinase